MKTNDSLPTYDTTIGSEYMRFHRTWRSAHGYWISREDFIGADTKVPLVWVALAFIAGAVTLDILMR